MARSRKKPEIDPRPACPECGSREVHFYGGALFYIDRYGDPHLYEPHLPKDPEAPAWCKCEWVGQRRDLI